MNIETLKKKLAAALDPYETIVNKQGDYCRITVVLKHNAVLVGFYPLSLSYDQIDFEAIKTQAALEEAKNVADAVYVIEGTEIILHGAFRYCMSISEVNIPDSVKAIMEYAFEACHGMKKVSIGEGVSLIGSYAFENCSSLTSIRLPQSVKEIGDHAFSGCAKLEDIFLPSNLNDLSHGLFRACYSLKRIALPKELCYIGIGAFERCKDLQEIKIPDGLITIEKEAFSQCDSLQSITIPPSVRYIEVRAFAQCKSLKRVTILSTAVQIGAGAFSDCPLLETVTFPREMERMEEIPDKMFKSCKSLKEFVIPSTVKRIGDNAFSGCSSLSEVKLPESLESIGKNAFEHCSFLNNITLPSSLTQIGRLAFKNTSIPFPIICNNVLNYVPQNTSGIFIVPTGVERIEAYAFEGTDITDVSIPETVREIGQNAFDGCKKLQSVNIPSQVSSIEEDTFNDCTSLVDVTLSENLRTIEAKAFCNCPIHKLVIPGKVFHIGHLAFGNCNALTELTFTKPILAGNIDLIAFMGCTALTTVNLPKGMSWKKIKGRFYYSPWAMNEPTENSSSAAKRTKLNELETASYKVMIDSALAPHLGQVTVENTIIKVTAELPGKSFIVAEFPLTGPQGRKIPVTEFNCDTLKTLVAEAKPNTTYWLYPQGTIIKRHMTQSARRFMEEAENLVLMSGITGIDDHAFEGFKGLRHVILSDTVKAIGQECFADTSLEEPVIVEGTLCFAPLGSQDTSYTVPDTVSHIAPYAFKGYNALEEIIIPESVKIIAEYAFSDCTSLHRVAFANPVRIHSFMRDKLNNIEYRVTENYTTVDNLAFSDCKEIKEFIVPNSAALLGSIIPNVLIEMSLDD